MKKFSKREIAWALACISFFGNKTSAMNQSEVKNLGNIIDYIAKYTKEKLGILPCLVHYDGKHCFYFKFSLDASNKEFREDKLINCGEHTSLKFCFGTHISCSKPDILCDLEVWRKKTN